MADLIRKSWLLPAALVLVSIAGCTSGGTDSAAESEDVPATMPAANTQAASTTELNSSPPEPVTVEVEFSSGDFELVGDLVLPGGEGPYPAVIAVHGSGPATRNAIPGYWELRTTLLEHGFALLSWDKPGSGQSTGTVEFPTTQRATILADGVSYLAGLPEVDPARIGLWGLSQAGWVMPKALEETDGVAFMIVVSGGAEDSIEQTTYLLAQQLACRGGTIDDARIVEEEGSNAFKASTYEEYRAAAELVYDVPDIQQVYRFEIAAADDWSPPSPETDIESWFDPMTVVRDLTIPVFAVYGDMDKNIDPVQATDAYTAAFAAGGHELSEVELIPGVGHTMQEQETGCIGEPGGSVSDRYLELLDRWIGLMATEL